MNTHAFHTSLRSRFQPAIYIVAFLIVLIAFATLIHMASAKSVLGADFYTFWVAGKAFVLDGANPYSQSVTEAAQMGILGRLAQPDEDQLAFSYPPYVLFAILPVLFLRFDWAVAFWLAFNILTFFTVLFLILPPSTRRLALTSLTMFPIALSLILGNFDILLASGVLIFFGLVVAQGKQSPNIQVLAALLLAWGTAKPQFIWLVLGFALLYAFRKRLYLFLGAFFGFLALFLGLSFLFVPNWISAWTQRLQEYAGYVQSRPTLSDFLSLLMPSSTALLVTGVAFVICALISIYLLIRWWQGKLHWLKVLAWLSMLTYLFHLHGISYEQVIFLLPLILWVGQKDSYRTKEVIGFWAATLIISWLGFVLGRYHVAFDRSPVLFNALWVGWLFAKSRLQL